MRPERMAQRAARQQRAQLVVGHVGLRQAPYLSRLDRGDGQPVAIEDAVPMYPRHPVLRREDADQVQRIDGAQHDELIDLLHLPHRAQPADRIGGGELLAAEAGDEAPAADLAARFEAPVDAHQVAPGRQLRLALQHRSEDDAVALEQRACDRLDVIALVRDQQRPAPRRLHQSFSFVDRSEQCAQSRKAVGGGNARACQLRQPALDERRQQAGCFHQLVEERCAALLQRLADCSRFR